MLEGSKELESRPATGQDNFAQVTSHFETLVAFWVDQSSEDGCEDQTGPLFVHGNSARTGQHPHGSGGDRPHHLALMHVPRKPPPWKFSLTVGCVPARQVLVYLPAAWGTANSPKRDLPEVRGRIVLLNTFPYTHKGSFLKTLKSNTTRSGISAGSPVLPW